MISIYRFPTQTWTTGDRGIKLARGGRTFGHDVERIGRVTLAKQHLAFGQHERPDFADDFAQAVGVERIASEERLHAVLEPIVVVIGVTGVALIVAVAVMPGRSDRSLFSTSR